MEQNINKQAECLLGQVTEYYPQTSGCSLLAQSLMDFDKLYLNEFPTPTTQSLHSAAQYYHPTEISKGISDSLIFLQKKTKDNKREAALNELSRHHLSEELSLWGTHHLFVYASRLNCCTAENIHLIQVSHFL